MENNGWAVFITTPRGSNHAANTLKLAKSDPDWFAQVLAAEDTGVFTKSQLEKELRDYRSDYGEEEGSALFEQEYNCSFESALIGSFYGPYLTRMAKDGRICRIPVDRTLLVHTAWDLGVSDSTAIWFIQRAGQEYRLIDYHEASGVGLDDYARVLEEKRQKNKWIYGNHYFPHDIAVRELGNKGKSREDTMRELGFQPTIVAQSNVMDGINAVRKMLDQSWIDETACERGLNALRNYRREWDDRLKMFRDSPLHDWACVGGETKVLTRYGMYQIMDLPQTGEVLTPCGWKQYQQPRITRRNAPLVAVRFSGGFTVRCTADHLFLTPEGWKYAEDLQSGMLIQSCLTRSRSISMAVYTAYGRTKDIIHAVVSGFILTSGLRSLDKFRMAAIFTTRTMTIATMHLATLSACRLPSTYPSHGSEGLRREEFTPLRLLPVSGRRNGTDQMPGYYGTSAMQNDPSHGRNGKGKIGRVLNAVLSFSASFVQMVTSKNTAPKLARALAIESVSKLSECEDVWCLTVPDGAWWSLENGAVTHNSHGSDALRTFACGYRNPRDKKSMPVTIPNRYPGTMPTERGTGWMGRG